MCPYINRFLNITLQFSAFCKFISTLSVICSLSLKSRFLLEYSGQASSSFLSCSLFGKYYGLSFLHSALQMFRLISGSGNSTFFISSFVIEDISIISLLICQSLLTVYEVVNSQIYY